MKTRKAQKSERFSVIPPMGSNHRIAFHSTETEARTAAFNVAAESPQDGKTEVVERTRSSYRTVGWYDYLGRWNQ